MASSSPLSASSSLLSLSWSSSAGPRRRMSTKAVVVVSGIVVGMAMAVEGFVPATGGMARRVMSSSSSLKESATRMTPQSTRSCWTDLLSLRSSSKSEENRNENGNGDSSSSTTTYLASLVNGESEETPEEEGQEQEEDWTAESMNEVSDGEGNDTEKSEEDEQAQLDSEMMQLAMEIAAGNGGGERGGGERGGGDSPFPKPLVGAVIVSKDGKILGQGRSTYRSHAIEDAIANAGLTATPLREWFLSWTTADFALRQEMAQATLYLTLEPCAQRQGTQIPPLTQLVIATGVRRVVIGCPNPIDERALQGAAALHAAGIAVQMGVQREACQAQVSKYAQLITSKLQRMGRQQFAHTGRPLGYLHCSVIDSTNAEAFARNGNAFGSNFGGQHLSYRDFGSYELAPPPEQIWARPEDSDTPAADRKALPAKESDKEASAFLFPDDDDDGDNFEDELNSNPMMPWYEQVDACIATFPRKGDGPQDSDQSIRSRLFGLNWLAAEGGGRSLPPNVERILVMDATDLHELPLDNANANLPPSGLVDIEAFWSGQGRKPTRILLRRASHAQALATAEAAAASATAAAQAARAVQQALETGQAEAAAEAALQAEEAAMVATKVIQEELARLQDVKEQLVRRGVRLEHLEGGEPIHVMNYLGQTNGYTTVMWRAGCWGERGVQSILAGAFQCVSAHLAVDAVGGKFWQLMLAEKAVQAACGPERKVKIFAEQEDFSLEYCDQDEDDDDDDDCFLVVDGRRVRHVRLDCRVALVDEERPTQLVLQKMKPFNVEEEAPWFL